MKHFSEMKRNRNKVLIVIAIVVISISSAVSFQNVWSVKPSPTWTYRPGETPPPEIHGWITPTLYYSPVYKIKPGMTIEHIIIYEKASPHDLATMWLVFRSAEREGLVEYYINGKRWGLGFISEEVALGELIPPCCAIPWMDTPERENIQALKSISFEGKFQFVFQVLYEEEG